MMRAKSYLFIGVIAVAVVAICAAVCLMRTGDAPPEEGEASRGNLVRKIPSAVKKAPGDAVREAMRGMESTAEARTRNRRPLRPPADLFAGLAGEDRRLAESVYDALENDDFSATIAAATKAMTSTNAEVRSHAVEALSWFGADALPELTEAMTDPDEDVSEAAETAWEVALAEVGNPSRRFAIAAAAMGSLSNEDHLSTISGHLSGAALEMIDSESDEAKASEKRIEVVQTLVDLIADANDNGAAEAKEAYEDITGNEWRGFDEAERYVSDPENYELPEDREELAKDDDVAAEDNVEDDAEEYSEDYDEDDTDTHRSRKSSRKSKSSSSSSSTSSSKSFRSSSLSSNSDEAPDAEEAADAAGEEEGAEDGDAAKTDEAAEEGESELDDQSESDGDEELDEDEEGDGESEEGNDPPPPALVQ